MHHHEPTHDDAQTCPDWNGMHDCGLDPDHGGDHECAGCGTVWNPDPFGLVDPDDLAWFEWQRDVEWPEDERCAWQLVAQAVSA